MSHFKGRMTRHLKQMQQPQQVYDYFLVLDFEATCDSPKQIVPQEIIEFPVLKVNATTFQVDSQFHRFVKPIHHPLLTDFCVNLTTITQDETDAGMPFPEVFKDFEDWMKNDVGVDSKRCLFVTCGDWDLKTMLPNQCHLTGIDVPHYCSEWLNIKKAYHLMTGSFCKGMMPMITELGLSHYGTLHRGLDDCINIANIMRELSCRGCKFLPSFRTQ